MPDDEHAVLTGNGITITNKRISSAIGEACISSVSSFQIRYDDDFRKVRFWSVLLLMSGLIFLAIYFYFTSIYATPLAIASIAICAGFIFLSYLRYRTSERLEALAYNVVAVLNDGPDLLLEGFAEAADAQTAITGYTTVIVKIRDSTK